ncbi:MAG: GNAT family N-acetyltransferase, partial [Muribaculaceae bacterium]|nr:GNAT family N-acetyltransferase [Muribaculaceae bacterium]
TPELAIALYPEYRNKGIGSRLLASLLEALQENGFERISLSVDKNNYAVRMYLKLGFQIVSERKHDYLMIKTLNSNI